MENSKIFMGNLDFSASEAELKSLLSKFGTVIAVKLNQKKGHAVVEMQSAAEAVQAVQQLDGTKHREREIRLSLYMKARKARAVTVKRYKERGATLAKQRLESLKAPERALPTKKPTYSSRSSRVDRKPDSARSPGPGSGYKPRERSAGSETKSFKSPSRERTGPVKSSKKEWSSPRPKRSPLKPGDSRAERPERIKSFASKPRNSSQPRSPGDSQNRFAKSTRPGRARGANSFASSKPQTRVKAGVRGKSSRKTDR